MKKDYTYVIEKMDDIANKIYFDLSKTHIPSLELPTRSKSNILFDDKLNVWKYGKNKIQRSAKSLDGAYMLLRTMYMTEFIKEMIKVKKSSTLREMYYISEGWDLAKFHSQNESNLLAEDLEVMTSLLREDFKLRPEEDGARVIGNITIEEITRNNTKRKIHCQDDVGDSGYSIPYNAEPEKLKFKNIDVDFIIAIETGGMFDRLAENHFDEDYKALLVHLKGQPARSTRRFIKRINEEKNLPVIVFTDCDPWSFRIFASVAYGAIKTAHISEYLATPSATYLGVTPSDIENYNLPTDSLTNEDIKSLKSELTDPRFQDRFWKQEIKLQLKMGKKSEQQALAKYGLDFVTDTYLPEKLNELGMIKK
jgi:DNA topoisomerase-6 subunit A